MTYYVSSGTLNLTKPKPQDPDFEGFHLVLLWHLRYIDIVFDTDSAERR